MSTFRELVYMVLDEVKLASDDAYFTEDHVIYLISKYRAFILKQRYSDIKKVIPESNYQTICLDLEEVESIAGECCCELPYLRSKDKIPFLMKLGITKVYPIDYYKGEITYISRDRMKYVCNNKYLKNIIYTSIGPDNYLYFKSCNPQFLYLQRVKVTGIFENPEKVSELECSNDKKCDLLDREFPLEEGLIPPVIELVVKELIGATYRPEDKQNNADDNLSEVTISK